MRMLLQPQPGEQLGTWLRAVERSPKAKILVDRELAIQLRLVADPADRATPALDVGAATLGLDESRENLEQRRLSRAVRSEDREGLAGLYGK